MGDDVLKKFGVTDEQLDAWEEDASRGVFPGKSRGEVVIGRPRLADEPLRDQARAALTGEERQLIFGE